MVSLPVRYQLALEYLTCLKMSFTRNWCDELDVALIAVQDNPGLMPRRLYFKMLD